MDYGSPFYIFSLAFLLGIGALLWALLRKRNTRTQRIVIGALMLANVVQHLFKSMIYPQYLGDGFTALSSAYNMCAVLIIVSPAALLLQNRFLKNFVYFVGTVAGIGAIAVPYWFIGKELSELGWEYARFYLCHGILFLTSLMPLLLGLHKPSYKEFWQVGLGFLLALCVILVNDVVFMVLGLYPGAELGDLYGSLLRENPCLIMGPPRNLPWVAELAELFSPSVFLGNNATGQYVPILWYAVPMYLGITLISFAVFAAADRKRLSEDIRRLKREKAESNAAS